MNNVVSEHSEYSMFNTETIIYQGNPVVKNFDLSYRSSKTGEIPELN